MKTSGVASTIISTIRTGVVNQLAEIEKKPFNGVNIQYVEKKFFDTIGESGVSGLSELFSCNDETASVIIYEGEKHYRKYFSTGKYLTLLGEVVLKRGIYQSNKVSHSICPLEQKLKFVNDYVSFAAAEYICYSLASMTLGEFIKHCRKWMHMKPSEGTIRRVLDYIGKFLEDNDFFSLIHSDEQVSSEAVTLAISMDATSILLKGEGWRHATAATISTYNAEGDRLDTIYIGRMPETGKRRIKTLLEKEVQTKMTKQKFKNIVCIADGARELWRYFHAKYPNTIHVVDFFHVCEHLSTLSQLLFRDTTESQNWYKKYRTILKETPNGASKLLRAARYRRSLVKKNPEIDAEIKYFQHNRIRMNYFELRKKNLPIGSGVVEAACKNLIGARMKKSGMRWTNDGGQTILTLRALLLSNRWDKFWAYFVSQHFPIFKT